MLPEVGSGRLSTILATVDLPEPDSPSNARVEPGRKSQETSSTALQCCYLPRESRTVNSLVRLRTEITDSSERSSDAPAINSEVSIPASRAALMREEASDGAAVTKRLV